MPTTLSYINYYLFIVGAFTSRVVFVHNKLGQRTPGLTGRGDTAKENDRVSAVARAVQSTQESYVRAVRQLAEHYHKLPDLITEEELRQYFAQPQQPSPAHLAKELLAFRQVPKSSIDSPATPAPTRLLCPNCGAHLRLSQALKPFRTRPP